MSPLVSLTKHVRVVLSPAGRTAEMAPSDAVSAPPLGGEQLSDPFFCETYVDDTIGVEALIGGNKERLLSAIRSSVSDHLRMLGY